MNIYKFELKMLINSMIIWGLAIPLSLFLYLSFFPLMAGDASAFEALLANYPEEFLAFFGMRSELPMSSLLGYFSLTFGMIQIPLSIQASNYGFHMLSVEERELTADFLLSKPITRTKIFVSKFLASLTALTVVNVLLWIVSIVSLLIFKGDAELNLRNVNILLSTTILFQLFFVSIGMLVSVSVRKISSVIAYSMTLGFGMYIVFGLKSLFSSDIMAFITPYAYFEPVEILITGKYDLLYTLVAISIIVISLTLCYFLYNKRNIHSL